MHITRTKIEAIKSLNHQSGKSQNLIVTLLSLILLLQLMGCASTPATNTPINSDVSPATPKPTITTVTVNEELTSEQLEIDLKTAGLKYLENNPEQDDFVSTEVSVT